MKPKRTQRTTGPNWHGKGVNPGDKTSLNQAKQASFVSPPARVRPFAGKVFYLDLPSNKVAETLERDINELGGTVEEFFSKEIKYLVSNKREARYVHCLRHDSPAPSPESGPSSPHPPSKLQRPASHGDRSKTQGQTETFVTSRGKSLVERVVREQERLQMNKILSNALEWGVKILYIDDVIAYVHKKKKMNNSQAAVTPAVKSSVKAGSSAKQGLQKYRGASISKPFIKVEDSSRHYRPVYLTLTKRPEFNLKTVAPCSPFCLEDPPGNKQRGHRGVNASASEDKAQARKKNRDKKRGGYCECCLTRYDNLTAGACHRAFSKSKQYSVVDRLISTLHCNFIPNKTKVKRPKCSAASVLLTPGPRTKTETVTEEKQPAEECEGSYLNITPASDSGPLTHRDGDPRTCYTHSHRPKQMHLARKRACRQNSLTSCAQKAKQERVPRSKSDTNPSSGDFFPPRPSRVYHDELLDQKPHKHKSSSSSQCQDTNIQPEISTETISKAANEFQSKTDAKPQDHNKFSEKVTEEKEAETLPAKSSPVLKIQRRIRVYKRKRRKVDSNPEHVKPRDVAETPVLMLWELFQSSDNMDVEFRGFEDEEGPNNLKG